jgi:leader peptidase (prepilin peptidase)/N-methyltransferase
MTADLAEVSATMVFLALLGTLMITDARWYRLPIAINLTFGAAGLAIGHWAFEVPLADRVIAAGAGYLGLQVISKSYRLVRGRPGMGAGDPVMLGGLGAWLGWQHLPMIVLVASLLGLIVAVFKTRRSGFDQNWDRIRLPLGSLMAIAAIMTEYIV